LEINREFYQRFAAAFADKRKRLQPGVLQAIVDLPMQAQVLELGCGHAALAAHLHRHGFQGSYVGLDLSQALLDRRAASLRPPTYEFQRADLSDSDWPRVVAASPRHFEWVLAFAVLHHLPTEELRLAILTEVRRLLSPAGSLALSVWDFLQSPRMQRRIIPWEQAGLNSEQVDRADFLLDWRHAGKGLRYVHHFESEELRGLAAKAGFQVIEQYHSDEGLGLYQRWRPRAADALDPRPG
jgi:SAM-dependent methyltransferase